MAKGYLVSAELLQVMGEIARWWKENRAPAPPLRNFRDVPGASDTYIALVPNSGIAGLTDLGTSSSSSEDEVPQYADCAIWKIANDGTFSPISGLYKRVYNLDTGALIGGQWTPVTKDKFGNWIAQHRGAKTITFDVVTAVSFNTGTCTLTVTTKTVTITGSGLTVSVA